ncbi:thiamine pyrophosphate-dependent enzyme [Lentibacillus songyuanensis]|uniref:thiamine pyrophosphate-dependent enzyme n=1 Tax=Lentibacillus songyuanensis TaxID=3136161 RepID=UPI0038620EC8
MVRFHRSRFTRSNLGKLACPDSPVICITGDGGVLMNFAEIETENDLVYRLLSSY